MPGQRLGHPRAHRGVIRPLLPGATRAAAAAFSASTNSSCTGNNHCSTASSAREATIRRAGSGAAPLSTPDSTSTARTTSRSCCFPHLLTPS
ncbi:hypothetical protein, partial [Streptomyces clavuligerus]|uniref:hypothetical protein n=1 Tax=Streptomyces clavuligerus TaxID=1901 RepID=UPI001E59D0ED